MAITHGADGNGSTVLCFITETAVEEDQILVLDQGRIVQRGRHAELMQQGGIYADFVCSRRSAESWRIAERKSNEVKAEV